MPAIKTPAQLIETAIRIERKGLEYYRYLSRYVESDAAKDLFSFLAAEEEKHIGVFREMLDAVADYTPRYDYPGEYERFLSELADSAVKALKDYRSVMKTDTFQRAIALGIEVELQSIVFYSEFFELFPKKLDKVLTGIIDEEKKHFLELKSLQKAGFLT